VSCTQTHSKKISFGVWAEFNLKRNKYLVKKEGKHILFVICRAFLLVSEAVFINSSTASTGSLTVKILITAHRLQEKKRFISVYIYSCLQST
jgi:hypothetical protein